MPNLKLDIHSKVIVKNSWQRGKEKKMFNLLVKLKALLRVEFSYGSHSNYGIPSMIILWHSLACDALKFATY